MWQENGLNEDRVAESLIAEFSLNVGFSVEIRKCPVPQLGLQPEGQRARAAAPRQRARAEGASNAEAAARRPVEGGLQAEGVLASSFIWGLGGDCSISVLFRPLSSIRNPVVLHRDVTVVAVMMTTGGLLCGSA